MYNETIPREFFLSNWRTSGPQIRRKEMSQKNVFSKGVTRRGFLSKLSLTAVVGLGGFTSIPKESSWGSPDISEKATPRKNYRSLSRQDLLNKAYEQGALYAQNSGSCSQGTVAALHEILVMDDLVVKVATSSCGGQAGMAMGTCGGLIGGTIVLDYFLGRPPEGMSNNSSKKADIDALMRALGSAKLLFDEYIEEYGTVFCASIQQQLFGRHFYFRDPDELRKFREAGSRTDHTKCMHIVGNAALWTMQILLDKDVIEI
jgi:C_GCAxxG_C_C family probable redox protein